MLKNLQVITVKAISIAGAEIDQTKKEAARLAQQLKCSITFEHNGVQFIADHEGNVARLG